MIRVGVGSDAVKKGRWYGFVGGSSPSRRSVKIVDFDGISALGKFASGATRLLTIEQIGPSVEDAVPGVTERCLECGGREVVPNRSGGTKPCPNCQWVDADPE
jgi:hypothetical protein